MSDLFFGNALVDIEIFYKVTKNKFGFPIVEVLDDETAAKMKADPKTADSVRHLRTKWRASNWKTANDLLSQSMSYNHIKGDMDVNWLNYRSARVYAGLVEWSGPDVMDANGAPMPCSTANIDKMHSQIVMALLDKFDKVTAPSQEEIQKNSPASTV